MLSILRRSDKFLFKFVSESVASNAAAQLSEGHCFHVDVTASLKVDSFQETAFSEAMAPYHTSHGWYAVDLEKLLSAWLDCLDVEEPEIETASDTIQKVSKLVQAIPQDDDDDHELPDFLSFCDTAEAPLATEIRKFILEHMGKEKGKEVLETLNYKTTKQQGIMKRLFCYKGTPVTHAILNAAVN